MEEEERCKYMHIRITRKQYNKLMCRGNARRRAVYKISPFCFKVLGGLVDFGIIFFEVNYLCDVFYQVLYIWFLLSLFTEVDMFSRQR